MEAPTGKLPGLGISVLTSLLPIILLVVTTALLWIATINDPIGPRRWVAFVNLLGFLTNIPAVKTTIQFMSDPAIVMIISLAVATYTLGLRQSMSMKRIMDIYGEAVKDIAMILLIMGGAGALKQILVTSGVSDDIATLFKSFDIPPLILGWSIACLIRVCVGSATVAGLAAAGIIQPMLASMNVDPNLMVLSIGAGSLMFSHVNDTGFWLFKEYFNLSIKDTIRSWSLMETIVSIAGLGGVLFLNLFISSPA
jgi:Gnt-I system high-affinity gluconate transporter